MVGHRSAQSISGFFIAISSAFRQLLTDGAGNRLNDNKFRETEEEYIVYNASFSMQQQASEQVLKTQIIPNV